MNASNNKKNGGTVKKQHVQDNRGTVYELSEKLAEGGQGVVLRTRHDSRLLVKVSKWPDSDPRTQAWRRQIEVGSLLRP